MATVQFGCFSLVNDCQPSAAAGGNLNIGAKMEKSKLKTENFIYTRGPGAY